jgi:3-hydroxypropanoate dehydrogenase
VFRGQTGEKPHHGLAQWFVAGAYFNIAARGLGLDCRAMSGFDNEKLNAEYFPDGKLKSDFICAFGYGDASRLHPREPRLEFNEVAQIAWPR